MAVEEEFAAFGLVEAGKAVEEGGFSGAVRADQTGDGLLFDLEVDAVDCGQAAEDFGYLVAARGMVSYSVLPKAVRDRCRDSGLGILRQMSSRRNWRLRRGRA